MQSLLIKDTTRAQREQIVAESLGNINGTCDGCAAGVAEMYQDYIDGKREIRDINMEYRARYVSGMEVPCKLDDMDFKIEKTGAVIYVNGEQLYNGNY